MTINTDNMGESERQILLRACALWQQASKGKVYRPYTLGSILEDRLADLLVHKTVDADGFVSLVLADCEQDGIVIDEQRAT